MAELLKRRTIRATDAQIKKWKRAASIKSLSLNAWIRWKCNQRD